MAYEGVNSSVQTSAPLYSFINSIVSEGVSMGISYISQNASNYGGGSSWLSYLITFVIQTIISCSSNGERTITKYNFSQYANNFLNPLPAQFSRVIVKNSSTNTLTQKIGKTEYEFTSDKDFTPLVPIAKSTDANFNPFFFTQTQRSYNWMYGLSKSVKIYKYDAVTEKLVKDIQNFYIAKPESSSHNDVALTSCNCTPVYLDSKNYNDYTLMRNNTDANFTTASIPGQLYVDFCRVESGRAELYKTVENIYNANGDPLATTTNFEYNRYGLLSAQKTTDSKEKLINKKIYYYNDFFDFVNRPDNIYTQLWNQNRIDVPIATELWQTKTAGATEELLSSEIVEYGAVPNGDYRPLNKYLFESSIPVSKDIIHEFSYTNPPQMIRNGSYIKLKQQTIYNTSGIAAQINDVQKNKKTTTLFAYDNQYPVAAVTNANKDEVAYTSFEAAEKNNWQYDDARVVTNTPCVTGNKCFQLDWNYNNAIKTTFTNITKPFILSFWANNTSSAFTINGSSFTPVVSGPTINGWTFYQFSFAAGALTPAINGGCLIDELRWYPKNARMVSSTYDPGIGKKSECDINNQLMYYEYDGMGRLQYLKDVYKNILKAYEYGYQIPITN